MAINITHRFVSQSPDGPDNTLIQPRNWNDTHTLTMLGPRLLGNPNDANGNAVEIELGGGLSLNGTTLNAQSGPSGYFVPTSRTITAGSGLSGGGNLSANRSFAVDNTVLRTIGDQTISDTNFFKDGIKYNSQKVLTGRRRVDTGEGMQGGGDLTANRFLGVDSSIVRTYLDQNIGGTKNFGHQLRFREKHVVAVEHTDWDNATSFPIGHHVIVSARFSPNRNQSDGIRFSTSDGRDYSFSTTSPDLSGVWRARGGYGDETLMQRVA